jgi:uncharacterized protein (DUF924 family)
MYEHVLRFWFEETESRMWWVSDSDFDTRIRSRFSSTLEQAASGELDGWRRTSRGRLAEILVLDQFSRNIHRDAPLAFARDPIALVLSQEAIAAGVEGSLSPIERAFLYMPFMHSESRMIHERAEVLFRANGLPDSYAFELKHKAIIDRFGRYPHRNSILGRLSTAEEIEFLKQPGSSF